MNFIPLKFKRGQNENLQNVAYEHGAVYLTEDKHELHFDTEDKRIKITDTDAIFYYPEGTINFTPSLTFRLDYSLLDKAVLG